MNDDTPTIPATRADEVQEVRVAIHDLAYRWGITVDKAWDLVLEGRPGRRY